MAKGFRKISDERVRQQTWKSTVEWNSILDRRGARAILTQIYSN